MQKSIPHFICPCPTDGCKGLIDSKFYCNLCETSICKRCRLLLDGEEKHECDEEIVKTVKLLRGDTKACPKCATPNLQNRWVRPNVVHSMPNSV